MAFARAWRVRSSGVGPRPPVMRTRGACFVAACMASMMSCMESSMV